MNEEIKKLFVEMRKAHEEFKTFVNKQIDEIRTTGSVHPDTETTLGKINDDITQLRTNYEEMIVASKRSTAMEQRSEGGIIISPEEELNQRAFDKFLRGGMGETCSMDADEKRALSSSADKDGGFLIPTTFESEVITQAFDEGELRALCNVAPTGRDTVQLSALSKPVVAWGTRNLAVDPQDLSAGGERIEIFDLKALTLIANNTLDDAVADVWGELRDQFASAVAEAEDAAIAAAAGDKMPQGVISDERVQANFVKTGVAGALNDGSNNGVDALITMLQSLKKTYRRNATWAMNSTTEGKVRQFKDSQGQYLWQPPVQPGNPSTLLGRPLVNPESLPDVGANSFSIALGDFRRGYKLRDRSGLTVQRLVEKYAEYDQTGFLIRKRLGGQVLLPEAFVLLKTAA